MNQQQNDLIKQIIKFITVGAVNTGVDLFILNLLIWSTGKGTRGTLFGVFKALSFIVAAVNSYFLNKYWTFAGHQKKKKHVEASQFAVVTGIGWLINVAVATFVVNKVSPSYGLNAHQWINVAALTGTAVGLFWNFFGYRLFVFKHHHNDLLPPA